MNEERHRNESELIDWLCWSMATSAERWYPPRHTANECIAYLYEDDEEAGEEAIACEEGKHVRAFMDAGEFFRDLNNQGFDPVARAEREIVRSREERDLDLPDIDWTWYEDYCGERVYDMSYTNVIVNPPDKYDRIRNESGVCGMKPNLYFGGKVRRLYVTHVVSFVEDEYNGYSLEDYPEVYYDHGDPEGMLEAAEQALEFYDEYEDEFEIVEEKRERAIERLREREDVESY